MIFLLLKGGGIEEESDVSALLAHTAQYMPVRKTMDPSLSKNISTISTETNNQKNPSSANKNVLKSVNTHVNGDMNTVRKVRDTNGNRNGTTVAKNRPPKNSNSTSTSSVKSAISTQPKPLTPKVKKVVLLAEGEADVPKLSRRLKIQNKLEKRMKAAEEAGAVESVVGTVVSAPSTATTSETVLVSPNAQQVSILVKEDR